jgi:hypothetical protein
MEAVHFVQFFKRLRRGKKTRGLGPFFKKAEGLNRNVRRTQLLFFILRFSFLIFNLKDWS